MKTMTPVGISKQMNRFALSLSHATYELEGVETSIAFLGISTEGDTVKVSIYFDEVIVGEIGNIKLVDDEDDVVAHSTRIFIKPINKGLFTSFRYKLTEVEV